jgi:SAM-dependent methyltransferase
VCGGVAAPDAVLGERGLSRCGGCGFVFVPGITVEQTAALYDQEYFDDYGPPGGYDDEAQRRHEARLRVRWLRDHLPTGRVLELGSAAGYFLDELRTAGFDVQGIEPGAAIARRSAERFDLPITIGTVESAELPAASLDAVCAFHVLEHIAAPSGVLVRLRAALRPGGLLFLEVPNIESVIARRQGAAWPKLEMPYHVGHYAPETLRALLDRSGLEIVQLETFPAVGYRRLSDSLRPRPLAGQLRDLALLRANPRAPHPTDHELLRAVARRA